ncbi:hypothetical protein H0H92_010601 [Tricholoma furcatifolium]|nr:hypothetical protein H0H92_010601 [Tricholoma furcatifolium]
MTTSISPPSSTCEKATSDSGTFHQEQLGFKPTRRHIFAPWDSAYADAVHQDAATVHYTEQEERQVRRKIDRNVLPLIICSYMVYQFDRINIGNAHVLKPFNVNFGITDNGKWTTALGLFYVGYCLLEMPANMLQRYLGANRYFCIPLTVWGLASLSFVYSKGYTSLLVLRVLLGIGEAGYFAGMVYYMSFWYTRHELTIRMSIVLNGTLPGAISGLLAFGLVRAHTSLLSGWQFLFLAEAIPTLVLAVVIFFYLPPFPFAATFLTPRERAIAQARLNHDHRPQSHGGMTGWQGLKAIIADLHAWLFLLAYCGFSMSVSTISYFLPTLINGLGYSPIDSQGLTVAPYAFGCCLLSSFIGAFILRTRLSFRNRQNAEILATITPEEKQVSGLEELWDSDPRYVFMT